MTMSRVEICVCRRGYHVYKDVWDPYLGSSFTTKDELNNQHDINVTLAITHAFFHERWMNVPYIKYIRRRPKIIGIHNAHVHGDIQVQVLLREFKIYTSTGLSLGQCTWLPPSGLRKGPPSLVHITLNSLVLP